MSFLDAELATNIHTGLPGKSGMCVLCGQQRRGTLNSFLECIPCRQAIETRVEKIRSKCDRDRKPYKGKPAIGSVADRETAQP